MISWVIVKINFEPTPEQAQAALPEGFVLQFYYKDIFLLRDHDGTYEFRGLKHG